MNELRKSFVLQMANGCRIASVIMQRIVIIYFLHPSVKFHVFCLRAGENQSSLMLRFQNYFLPHFAISSPLASAYIYHSAFRYPNGMIARKHGGFFLSGDFNQRTKAGKDAFHVAAPQARMYIAVEMMYHKIHFFFQRQRLNDRRLYAGVGGADESFAVERNGKQHTPVVGVRNKQSAFSGEEYFIRHQMNALRRRNRFFQSVVVHLQHLIDKNPGRIDHYRSLRFVYFVGNGIRQLDASYFSLLMNKFDGFAIV